MTLIDNVDLSSIPSCLKQLQLYLDESKYSDASKLCHKCLKQWPGENAFYRVKVYCEIQLARWHSCLQTIGWLHGYRTHPAFSDKPRKRRKSGSNDHSEDSAKRQEFMYKLRDAVKVHCSNDYCFWFHFEQSYCYYKLGKYDLGLKALSMCLEELPPRELIKNEDDYPLDTRTFSDIKSTLLKAQLCLRMGHFSEASSIYASLKLKGAESLLSVNRLSVDLSLAADSPQDQREELLIQINRKIDDHLERGGSDDPYELYFNYACACVLSNDFLKAQDYLDLANEMLENELKSQEYDLEEQVEFANIFAFRAYLQSKRGNDELAQNLNNNLLETFMNSQDVDQATVLVALNNQLFFGCDPEKIGSVIHKIETLMKKEQISRKFSYRELNLIHCNCIWTYLTNGNLKECQRYVENFNRLLKPEDLLFFKAVLMCMDGKVGKAVSLLRQGAQISKQLKFVECMVKLLMRDGKNKESLSVLQQYYNEFVNDEKHVKMYFLLLVRVHIQLNSSEGVFKSLKQLLPFPEVAASDHAFKLGCKYLEDQHKHAEAAEVYNNLYSKNNDDKVAQVGILYNQSFLPQKYVDLPREYADSVVRDVRFIDAEELESGYKVTFQFDDQDKAVKSKVRKNRKRRNKKAQNPTGNPDPERWLHKHERAIYRKQAKRRKDATKGHTQGSTATVTSKPTTGTIMVTSSAIKRGKKKKR